jgi:hypothetical protein
MRRNDSPRVAEAFLLAARSEACYWAAIRSRSMTLSTVFADQAAPRAAGTPRIVNSDAIARADKPDMPSRRGRSDSVGY